MAKKFKSAVEISDHIYQDVEFDNGNSGATPAAVDWKKGNYQKITLTGNANFATNGFTAPGGVGSFQLKLIQDGTGSRTVTWPSSVKWPSGTAPTLTTSAGAVDLVVFFYDGTNYYANVAKDMR